MAVGARSRVRVPAPGRGEQWLAIATIFLLAFGLPTAWFQADNTAISQGDTSVIVVFAALFGIALTRLVGQWGHVLRAMRREPYLVAFAMFLVASTVWSTDPGLTFRRSIALLLTTFFGYYLVVRFTLRDIIRFSAIALMAGTAINLVWVVALRKYGVTNVTTEISTSGDWSGVFPQKNELGTTAVFTLMTLLFAARTFPRYRVTYYVFAALNVVLVIGAHSKTSLVSMALLIVLMALFTGLRGHRTLYGGVAVGLVGTSLFAAAFVTTNLGPITKSLGRDATLTGRTQLWTDVLHEIARKPVLGFGWSGFWTGGSTGPASYVLQRNLWHPPDAHNALLELLVNVGLIGAGLYLFAFLRGLFRSISFVHRTPGVLGLWPLVFFSYVLLRSVTELGIVGRYLPWALFPVAVALVGRDRGERRFIGPTAEPPSPSASALPPSPDNTAAAPAAKIATFTVRRPPT